MGTGARAGSSGSPHLLWRIPGMRGHDFMTTAVRGRGRRGRVGMFAAALACLWGGGFSASVTFCLGQSRRVGSRWRRRSRFALRRPSVWRRLALGKFRFALGCLPVWRRLALGITRGSATGATTATAADPSSAAALGWHRDLSRSIAISNSNLGLILGTGRCRDHVCTCRGLYVTHAPSWVGAVRQFRFIRTRSSAVITSIRLLFRSLLRRFWRRPLRCVWKRLWRCL